MSRGSTEFDSMESWLSHKTRGGGGKFLSGWKKEKGYVDTFMHCARLPLAIWRHTFPMYIVVEDKDTKDKVKHVYSKNFTCHELEDVLENPWRDKITGEREHPPKRCGLCKFDDWLWTQCQLWVDTHTWDEDKKSWLEKKKGKGEGIDPTTMLFDFESEASDSENTQLHAGGICNYFGKKELDDDVIHAMKKAKIRGDMTWKQNAKVKCSYAMCVVDNDNPAGGCQIAVETQALGEKVKEVIQKIWKSNDINIQKSPYCIKWEYFEKKEFSKKYDATAMMKIKPSPRVMKLIRGEPPDLTQLKEPFNQESMHAVLEQHCLVKDIPWDDFFPNKKQIAAWAKEDEAEEAEVAEAAKDNQDAADDAVREEDEADNPAEDDSDEEVACDKCDKAMKVTDKKCPHCGHVYEVEEEEEKPAPKKMKTRSELAKEKAAKNGNGGGSGGSKKPKKAEPTDEAEEDGDEIPFVLDMTFSRTGRV